MTVNKSLINKVFFNTTSTGYTTDAWTQVGDITYDGYQFMVVFAFNIRSFKGTNDSGYRYRMGPEFYDNGTQKFFSRLYFRISGGDFQVMCLTKDLVEDLFDDSGYFTINTKDWYFAVFTYTAVSITMNLYNSYPPTSSPVLTSGIGGAYTPPDFDGIAFNYRGIGRVSGGVGITYFLTPMFIEQGPDANNWYPAMVQDNNIIDSHYATLIPGSGNSHTFTIMWNMSLDAEIAQDQAAWDEYIDSVVNASHPKTGSEGSSSSGSSSHNAPGASTFGNSLLSAFQSLSGVLSNTPVFPTADFSLDPPFDGVADVVNGVINVLGGSLSDLFSSLISSLTGGINSVPNLIDDIISVIQDELGRIPTAIHNNITITVNSWWDLTSFANQILEESLDTAYTWQEKLLGLLAPDGTTMPANSLKIPKSITFTIFSTSYTFTIAELFFLILPPGVRTGIIPGSGNWPGRRSSDTRIATFLTDYSGVGVPFVDGIAALSIYSSAVAGIGVIAYFAPQLALKLIRFLLSLGSNFYLPSLKDIALGMMSSSNWDSQWNASTNLKAEINAVDSNVESIDSKVDSIDSDISSFRSSIESDISNLDSDVADFKSSIETSVSNLDTDLSELQSSVNSVSSDLSTHDANLTAHDDNLNSKISSLTSSLNDLSTDVTQLLSDISDLKSESESLFSDLFSDVRNSFKNIYSFTRLNVQSIVDFNTLKAIVDAVPTITSVSNIITLLNAVIDPSYPQPEVIDDQIDAIDDVLDTVADRVKLTNDIIGVRF
jgi:archaellum component FlaC